MQAIALVTVEPVAVPVFVGAEVDLANARGLGNHAAGGSNGLIEPGSAAIELVVELGTLGGINDQRKMPVCSVGVMSGLQPLLEVVGLGHGLAD